MDTNKHELGEEETEDEGRGSSKTSWFEKGEVTSAPLF